MGPRRMKPPAHACHRCGWRWMQRKAEYPKVCPHCHSTRWGDAKTDEEQRFHWQQFYVERHAFDLMRLVDAVSKGKTRGLKKRAMDLLETIDQSAFRRAYDERHPAPPRKT